MPSIEIRPLWGMYSRCISFEMVLLPEPLRPTRPMTLFSSDLMSDTISCRENVVKAGSYRLRAVAPFAV